MNELLRASDRFLPEITLTVGLLLVVLVDASGVAARDALPDPHRGDPGRWRSVLLRSAVRSRQVGRRCSAACWPSTPWPSSSR